MSGEARLSWGRLPSPPPRTIVDAGESLPDEPSMLPYGLGRSYGDVCLNPGGTLIRTRSLRDVLAFDRERGRLRAGAGVSVAEVLALTMPAGWFLPVIPGTQFVTLGGAVANDVHGKNHHRDGSFGHFVRSLELERSDGSVTTCSRDDEPELFAATIGGLGLTGLIRTLEIDLLRIADHRVDQTIVRFGDVADFFSLNDELADRHRYTVAWIDAMHPSGRGIYIAGDHPEDGSLPALESPSGPRISVPVDAPEFLINRAATRAFNGLYWLAHPRRERRSLVDHRRFFFPLDRIGAWNRLYGRRGFFQYQFVIPHRDASEIIAEVLTRVRAHEAAAPLAVLKAMGDVPPVGMLSFPMPGITLALDVANEGNKTATLFADFDAIIRAAGGRLYPAKDARMPAEDFQRAYPQWREFAEFMDPAFSSGFWRRVSRSLG